MNWLDIAIIIIAIFFGLLGLRNGIIRSVFGFGGLIAGIFLAGHYYQPLAVLLSPSGADWSNIAAFAIIIVATVVVASLLGWLIARLASMTPLGLADRIIGFILGIGAGSILFAAILAAVAKYIPSTAGIISQSTLAKILIEQFPLLLALLPDEFNFINNFFV
ncbi:MAG: CvpA family protein [Dehalococcoidia bacterium]|nr:CvpA family protein [Dehalococcoidia bacterium]